MALEHDPAAGVVVEEELSSTAITLTQKRGGWVLMILGCLVAFLVGRTVFGANLGAFGYPTFLVMGILLNQFKTRLRFSGRAVAVERVWLGRTIAREVVAYETIADVDVVSGWLGSRFELQLVDGSEVLVRHGNPEDHASVVELLRVHRGATASLEEVQVPEPLRAMRERR